MVFVNEWCSLITEEMDRGEVNRRPTRSYRGRGGVSRRGERSRGRGRGGRGNLRVGKRKRLENRDTCQFFLQGRCHRVRKMYYIYMNWFFVCVPLQISSSQSALHFRLAQLLFLKIYFLWSWISESNDKKIIILMKQW